MASKKKKKPKYTFHPTLMCHCGGHLFTPFTGTRMICIYEFHCHQCEDVYIPPPSLILAKSTNKELLGSQAILSSYVHEE